MIVTILAVLFAFLSGWFCAYVRRMTMAYNAGRRDAWRYPELQKEELERIARL